MNEENMLQVANEVNEIVADSISSLILILIGLQERNKSPPETFYVALNQVIEACSSLSGVAHSFAEEDYEEYPELQAEINESADVVDFGGETLNKISDSLKTSKDLSNDYQNLVNTIRDVGANCIRMLQTIFGAGFKRIEIEQKKAKELEKDIDLKVIEEDPEKLCNTVSEYCSLANQTAEHIRELAKNEENIYAKEELLNSAEKIENCSDNMINALNALFEDPENTELIAEYNKCKKELEMALEEANKPVCNSKAVIDEANKAFEEQNEVQKSSIKNQMNVPVDYEKSNKLGCEILNNLDLIAEGVYWDDAESFMDGTKEAKSNIPKYISRMKNEAKSEKNENGEKSKIKEEIATKLENEFVELLEEGKAILQDGNSDEDSKNKFIEKYKNYRDNIEKTLEINECLESEKPNKPSFCDVSNEFDFAVINEENSNCKLPEDEKNKIKRQYNNIDALEFAVENGNTNVFVDAFKSIQTELPELINENNVKARNEKDVKLNKINNKMSEELKPVLVNSKNSVQNKQDENIKKQAKEQCEKYKEHFADLLVNAGMSKKEAEKYLNSKNRNDDIINDLRKDKEQIMKMEEAINDNNANGFVKEAKITIPLNNEICENISNEGKSENHPIKSNYGDNMKVLLNNAVNCSKEVLKEPKNNEKNKNCKNAYENMKNAIDAAILLEGGNEEDKEVFIKEIPDNDIVKCAKLIQNENENIKNGLFEMDNNKVLENIAKMQKDTENLINELLNEKDENNKENNKKKAEKLEKIKEKLLHKLKEAIKENDPEKIQEALNELNNLENTINDILDKEGKKEKEINKKAKKVKEGIKTMEFGVKCKDEEIVKKGKEIIKENLSDLKEEMDKKNDNKNKFEEISKELQKGSQEVNISLKDPENKEKCDNCIEALENCIDLIDSINNNEDSKENKEKDKNSKEKEKEKEKIQKLNNKQKMAIEKMKEELYNNEPEVFAKAIKDLENCNNELIDEIEKNKSVKDSKIVEEKKDKNDEKLKLAIEAIKESKKNENNNNSDNLEDIEKAENKLDELYEICDAIDNETGKETASGVKEIKLVNKELNKLKKYNDIDELNKEKFENSDFEKNIEKLNDIMSKEPENKELLEKIEKCKKEITDNLNNKEKEEKAIEEMKELIEDVLLVKGDIIPNKSEKNKICEKCRKIKENSSKAKQGMIEKEPNYIEKHNEKINKDVDDLIKLLKEKKNNYNKEKEKDPKKIKEIEELIENLKEAQKESDKSVDNYRTDLDKPEKRRKAEDKLEYLEKMCNSILKGENKPIKETGIKAKKVKEDLKKIEEGIKTDNNELIKEGKEDLENDKKNLIKEMNKESEKNDSEELKRLIEKAKEIDNNLDNLNDSIDKIDDILIYEGEAINNINDKEKYDKEELKKIGKIKNDTSKYKEDMYNDNEKQQKEVLEDLKKNIDDLKNDKQIEKEVKEIENIIKEIENDNDRIKNEQNCDKIDEICDKIKEIKGYPSKESAIKAKKMKETIKKMEAGMNNNDNKLFVEGAKEMKNDTKSLIDSLTEEAANEENDEKDELALSLSINAPKCLNESVLAMKEPNNKTKKEKAIKELEKTKEIIDDILKINNDIPYGYENSKTSNKELIETAKETKKDNSQLYDALINGDEEEKSDKFNKMKNDIEKMIEKLSENIDENPNNKKLIEKLQKELSELEENINNNDKESNEKAKNNLDNIDDICNEIFNNEGKLVKESEKKLKKAEKALKELREAVNDKDNEEIKNKKNKLEKAIKEATEALKKENNKDKEALENIEEMNKIIKDLRDIENYENDTKDKEKKEKCIEKMDKIEDLLDKCFAKENIENNKKDKYNRKALENLKKAKKNVKENKTKEALEEAKEANKNLDKLVNELGEDINDKAKKEAIKPLNNELNEKINNLEKEPRNPNNKKEIEKTISKLKDVLNNDKNTKNDYIDENIENILNKIGNLNENENNDISDEIKDLEELLEIINLDEDEEIKVICDDISKKQEDLYDALKEGDFENAKEIIESIEKEQEKLGKIKNKKLSKDGETLEVKALENVLDSIKEQCENAENMIDNKNNNKENMKKINKNNNKIDKEIDTLKGVIGKQMPIIAEQKKNEIEQDLIDLAKAIEDKDNQKIKELKNKLNKDKEDYKTAINNMLQNAEIDDKKHNEILKDLENNDKKINKIIDDVEEGKNIDNEDVQSIKKDMNNIENSLNINAIAKATDVQNDLDKIKTSIKNKDHKIKEENIKKAIEDFEEFTKQMQNGIDKETDPKQKKLIEEALKKAENSFNDFIKNCENSNDLNEIEKYSKIAEKDFQKCKELCGQGKNDKGPKLSERLDKIEEIKNSKNPKEKISKLNELAEMIKNINCSDPEAESNKAQLLELISQAETAEGIDLDDLLDNIEILNKKLNENENPEISQEAQKKSKGKAICAMARKANKKSNKGLADAARKFANGMKNIKNIIKEEVNKDKDNLSDKARQALELDDMLSDINMTGEIQTEMFDDNINENEEGTLNSELNEIANMIMETSKEESQAKATGRQKKMIQVQMPEVCGDIAVHFKHLANHANNQNKEGIILEGRAISAQLLKFCKELQTAQPTCRERFTADNMGRSLVGLRNLATQLKILCSVKAGTVGKGDNDADEQLICMSKTIGTMIKEGMQNLSTAKRLNLLTK